MTKFYSRRNWLEDNTPLAEKVVSVTDKDQFRERRFSFYILIIYFGVFFGVLVTLGLMNFCAWFQYKRSFWKAFGKSPFKKSEVVPVEIPNRTASPFDKSNAGGSQGNSTVPTDRVDISEKSQHTEQEVRMRAYPNKLQIP